MKRKHSMNKRQTISALRRRLPHITTADIRDVYEVLTEVWADQLAQPGGSIAINGLGQLYVEIHTMRSAGAVGQMLLAHYGPNAPQTLRRRVIRFRASQHLQAALNRVIGGKKS